MNKLQQGNSQDLSPSGVGGGREEGSQMILGITWFSRGDWGEDRLSLTEYNGRAVQNLQLTKGNHQNTTEPKVVLGKS